LGRSPNSSAPSGRLCCREAMACVLGSCMVQRRLCGAASCKGSSRVIRALKGPELWLVMCARSHRARRLCGATSRRGDPRLQEQAKDRSVAGDGTYSTCTRRQVRPEAGRSDSLRRLCGAATSHGCLEGRIRVPWRNAPRPQAENSGSILSFVFCLLPFAFRLLPSASLTETLRLSQRG